MRYLSLLDRARPDIGPVMTRGDIS